MAHKISTSEFYVLLMLGREEKHGYQIMKEVRKLLGDEGSFGPAILYTSLNKLLSKGLVNHGRIMGRRRYYITTLYGIQVLQAYLQVYQRVLSQGQEKLKTM